MKTQLNLLFLFLLTSAIACANPAPLKAPHLKHGDTVALISSGFRVNNAQDVQFATERLHALGLKVKYGKAILDQNGYFAGSDEARATEINRMFLDPSVKAIFELRGGFGSARLLDKIDYNTIRKHPKIVVGFSDITALLLAIHTKTQLITFHGPIAAMAWPTLTTQYLSQILFDNKPLVFQNPSDSISQITEKGDDVIQTDDRIITITLGKATGQLIGGNLTVITSLIGSKYLPNWHHKILFIEDTGEDVYRIDRMLNQLKLAGVLDQLNGFIFGNCQDCPAKTPFGSYRLVEVIAHYVKPLHIPAWYGAMIGHDPHMFTLPEGAKVSIDASVGRIQLLEKALV